MATFWHRIKGLFTSGAMNSAGGLLGSILQSGVAPRRGTRELLDAYRTSPWFHAVVHRIAQEVAAQRPCVHQRKVASAMERAALKRAGGAPQGSVKLDAHPLLEVLEQPNPAMTRGVFFYLLAAYLDTKGEVAVVIERDGEGGALELWPVPPSWIAELPRAGFPFFRFSHGSWQRTIPEDDVLYMRHPELSNPYARGVGIGETLADELDIDEFATKHVKNWFFNRALPDVFLYVEGVKSEAEAQRYEEKLRGKHGGRGKANQVHVTNGKVELKQVGHTFREQQLPEIRDQSRDIILQIFSVPPEVMGIVENSNRATIDAAMYLFMRGVIVPRLSFIADALTAWARVEFDDTSLAVVYESPVPEDAVFRLQVMQAQPSLFTKNEWRALAGLTAIEGWEEEFVEPPAVGFPAMAPGRPAAEEDDDALTAEPEHDETDDAESDAENRGYLQRSGSGSRAGRH